MINSRTLKIVSMVAVLASLTVHAQDLSSESKSLSLADLEQRLQYIDSRLEELASFSLRGGVGSIGYHSKPGETEEWIKIHLGDVYPIDEIVMIPVVVRDSQEGFKADGFPQILRIFAGTDQDASGSMIAEYRLKEGTVKGIAPLVISVPIIQASWIRVEASGLTPRAHSGQKALLLSEILVFSGSQNVALRRRVETSSNETGWAGSWGNRLLVDGHMPYLMDSAGGIQSRSWISEEGEEPAFILDLKYMFPISGIHLQTIEQEDTVPQAFVGDLGIPLHLLIEGASKPDFSDAMVLLDFQRGSFRDSGPIMMWHFPEYSCRYIRLSEIDLEKDKRTRPELSRIGFAEIEVFSDGENVARNKTVTTFPKSESRRQLSALTDGNNFFGKILPIREWLGELAERENLEAERPLIAAELTQRYTKQKTMLRHLIQLIIILVSGIILIVFFGRQARVRQASRIRERIAADLHDELGADLHTIGLYGDMALDSMSSPVELEKSLNRFIEFTEKSGEAARHCVNILEAKGICENLPEDLKEITKRMLADLDYDISMVGEEQLRELSSQKRIDLLLFFKECLTNILRHSGATHVYLHIIANRRFTCVEIRDNGKGFTNSSKNGVPPSLKRRARLMRANVSVQRIDTGGTRVRLSLKNRKFGFI